MKSYDFAKRKHNTQRRRSGELYINHPIRVAINLASNNYDSVSVCAGLMHDVLEDTDTTYEEIVEEFGVEIANLVNGVTKISLVKLKSKEIVFSDEEMFLEQSENYRKLLVAMAKDIRVLAIKLYDRLDNIRTIEFIAKYKIKFYARETIEIFAPIAERLGMGEIKGELEDLAFKYAYPDQYFEFIKIANKVYKNPQIIVDSVIPQVKNLLKENKIKFIQVSGRAKHLYSLYLKLKLKKHISNIFDIVALRIIVSDVTECYKSLGLIHSIFEPLPARIYDYIAKPKLNGYQSIHTTVKDNSDNIFEVQIRTQEMHDYAENGSAAHWSYKDNENKKVTQKNNKNEWLEEIRKISTDVESKEFLNTVREELFSKRIYVFSPRGEIIDLPQGSTPLDFAYKIHTELGNCCTGAKINNRIMPLSTKLEINDTVEVLSKKGHTPSRGWLSYVKTSYAKQKIRNYFKTKDKDLYFEEGMDAYQKFLNLNKLTEIDKDTADKLISRSKLPYDDLKSALCAIGDGGLNKNQLIKTLYPKYSCSQINKKSIKQTSQTIECLEGIKYSYAGCCKINKKDNIVGYLSKEHVIKIHRVDCKRIESADPRRIFKLNTNQ